MTVLFVGGEGALGKSAEGQAHAGGHDRGGGEYEFGTRRRPSPLLSLCSLLSSAPAALSSHTTPHTPIVPLMSLSHPLSPSLSHSTPRTPRPLLSQVFEQAIQCHLYPNSQIDITVMVLQTDGGTLCAAINAVTLALMDAGIPMRDFVVRNNRRCLAAVCLMGGLNKRVVGKHTARAYTTQVEMGKRGKSQVTPIPR